MGKEIKIVCDACGADVYGMTRVFRCEYLDELVDGYGYCHHGDEDRRKKA